VADVTQFAVQRARARNALRALSGALEQLEGPDGAVTSRPVDASVGAKRSARYHRPMMNARKRLPEKIGTSLGFGVAGSVELPVEGGTGDAASAGGSVARPRKLARFDAARVADQVAVALRTALRGGSRPGTARVKPG
jgi:hypothetical protein